ncbi:MAG: type II secretion system F family protein [Planctomycetota bacterium]|jgi:general secretion pathway protein F
METFIIISISIFFLYAILAYKWPAFAFLTLPLAVVLPFVFAAFYFVDDEVIIYASIIAGVTIFFTTLFIIIVSDNRLQPKPSRFITTLAKWILFLALVVGLLPFACGILFGPGGLFIYIFLLLIIGSIFSFSYASMHTTTSFIFSTIGSSIRQNLPLPMALESAATGLKDNRSTALLNIKKWLVEGYPLSEALKRGFPQCPGYALATITAAEKIDQLSPAIQAIEADLKAKSDQNKRLQPIHPLYPVIVIAFELLLVSMLMRFVIPKFYEVISEMIQGGLPAPTQVLLSVFDWFYPLQPIGLVLIVLLIFVIIPAWLHCRFRPRRPDKPYLVSRAGDFLKWNLPILHSFAKNKSMVHVLEILRLSLSSGCTVNHAIAQTLNLDINSRFKKKLKMWLQKVEAGENISSAAIESGLGTPIAWVFDNVNQNNTIMILQTLEDFYRLNYNFRANLARFILWPCVTIVMGATVAFIAIAILLPMVQIINGLASMVTP